MAGRKNDSGGRSVPAPANRNEGEEESEEEQSVQLSSGEEVQEGELEDGDDNVETEIPDSIRKVARNEYIPDASLTMEHVEKILGDRWGRMSMKERLTYKRKVAEMKDDCSRYMRHWVVRRVVETALKDVSIQDRTIKGLANYWASLSEGKRNSLKMKTASKGFWNATQIGASGYLVRGWEFKLESEYMTKRKIEYTTDGTKLDLMKGCFAKHATHALRTVRRSIFQKAKKKGGLVLAAKKTGIPGKKSTGKQSRRKDLQFHPKYLREVTKVKQERDLDGNSNEESTKRASSRYLNAGARKAKEKKEEQSDSDLTSNKVEEDDDDDDSEDQDEGVKGGRVTNGAGVCEKVSGVELIVGMFCC